MGYKKILDTLALIRKNAKQQIVDDKPDNAGDIFTGMGAAPRALANTRIRLDRNMEAAFELDIDPLPVKDGISEETAHNVTEAEQGSIEAAEEDANETEEYGETDGIPEDKEPIESIEEILDTEEINATNGSEETPEQSVLEENTPDTEGILHELNDSIPEYTEEPSEPEEIPSEPDPTLDDEIARLLEEDKVLADDVPNFDNIDFVKDISVFDRERRSLHEALMKMNDAEQEESSGEDTTPTDEPIHEHKARKPNKAIYLSGILVFTVLLTVSTAFFYSRQFPYQEIFGKSQIVIPVKIPGNAINSASYIFFNEENTSFETIGIKLKKMVYGQLSSIFYFDEDADLENYIFKLSDQSGRTYTQDMTLRKYPDSVVFQPFTAGVAEFALDITDISNNATESLQFAIKDKKMMPARYINTPIDISPDNNGSIVIDSAVFANTGTNIQLRLPYRNDSNIIITPETNVEMLDGAYTVISKYPADGLYSDRAYTDELRNAYPAFKEFRDNNVILARVDFEPVRSLDDNVILSVKGLSTLFYPQMTIETKDLFDFANKGNKVLQFDDVNLVIEGMQYQTDVIALVMHGEDKVSSDRIEVKVSIELLAQNRLGNEVVIQGSSRSGPQGTDVLFNVGRYPNINMDPQSMRIRIKSIQVMLNDINTLLKLSELDTEPLQKRQEAREVIEGLYPNPAQIDLMYMNEDSIIGSVLESSNDPSNGTSLVHIIKAVNTDGQWVILSDIITQTVQVRIEIKS